MLTEIEQFFFDKVDREGKNAVEYFSVFEHLNVNSEARSDCKCA